MKRFFFKLLLLLTACALPAWAFYHYNDRSKTAPLLPAQTSPLPGFKPFTDTPAPNTLRPTFVSVLKQKMEQGLHKEETAPKSPPPVVTPVYQGSNVLNPLPSDNVAEPIPQNSPGLPPPSAQKEFKEPALGASTENSTLSPSPIPVQEAPKAMEGKTPSPSFAGTNSEGKAIGGVGTFFRPVTPVSSSGTFSQNGPVFSGNSSASPSVPQTFAIRNLAPVIDGLRPPLVPQVQISHVPMKATPLIGGQGNPTVLPLNVPPPENLPVLSAQTLNDPNLVATLSASPASSIRPGNEGQGVPLVHRPTQIGITVLPPDGMEDLGCFGISTEGAKFSQVVTGPTPIPQITFQMGEAESGHWEVPVQLDSTECNFLIVEYTEKSLEDGTCKTFVRLKAAYDINNVHYQSDEMISACPKGARLRLKKPDPAPFFRGLP